MARGTAAFEDGRPQGILGDQKHKLPALDQETIWPIISLTFNDGQAPTSSHYY
jgi:hypothetical protein